MSAQKLRKTIPVVLGALLTLLLMSAHASDVVSGGKESKISKPIPYVILAQNRSYEIGEVATGREICNILKHPLFSNDVLSLKKIGASSVNYPLRWAGQEPLIQGLLRISKEINSKSWDLAPVTQKAVDENVTQCLEIIYVENLAAYEILKTYFLTYLSKNNQPCFSSTPRRCADFSYDGRDAFNPGYLSSSGFLAMITLKEGHDALVKMLDSGQEAILRVAVVEKEREAKDRELLKEARNEELRKENLKREELKRAELKKEELIARKAADDLAEKRWEEYKKKVKTVIEQTLNYSTTSNAEGNRGEYWRVDEKQKCLITKQPSNDPTIDIRRFNETAFRIRREPRFISPTSARPVIAYRFGDDNYFVEGFFVGTPFDTEPDLSRLRNAWGLIFKECPGRKSAF